MRVIINGVVAGPAEHPRLAYLSQHRDNNPLLRRKRSDDASRARWRGSRVGRECIECWGIGVRYGCKSR
jgi:hypothetical protein